MCLCCTAMNPTALILLMPESRARWISTTDAAKVLGVLPRAVQKRAARGSLVARKSGKGWEIDADALDAANGRQRDATDAATDAETDAQGVQSRDVVGASNVQNGRGPMDAIDAGERLVEARDEIKFLRALVESLTQSEAQTKAALREALKAMPKQLTAGTARDALTATPPRDAAQSLGAARDSSAIARDGPKTDAAAIDYNSIADEIERSLRQ